MDARAEPEPPRPPSVLPLRPGGSAGSSERTQSQEASCPGSGLSDPARTQTASTASPGFQHASPAWSGQGVRMPTAWPSRRPLPGWQGLYSTSLTRPPGAAGLAAGPLPARPSGSRNAFPRRLQCRQSPGRGGGIHLAEPAEPQPAQAGSAGLCPDGPATVALVRRSASERRWN